MRSDLNAFDGAIQNSLKASLEFLKPPFKGELKERFEIYANGYPLRTQSAMEEIFELLPKLLGEKEWHRLGGAYVRLHPSKSYSLQHIGEEFPAFLEKLDVDPKWISVARFELTIWDSFHAFNKSPESSLEKMNEIHGGSRFLFQSSAKLFQSEWNIAESWLNRVDEPQVERKKEYSLIFRDLADSLRVEILHKNEFELLSHLMEGLAFGDAVEALGLISGETLSKRLHFLISQGIVYRWESE